MVESAESTTAYSCGLENTWGMEACSKRPKENEEESATLAALTVEDDCVLDFSL